MFKLDILLIKIVLDLFPWPDNAFYGFGIYAKFILLLLFGQQVFNIIYLRKKGGKNKC